MSTEISSLRAAAHPLRLRILSLLTGAAMSAAEVARELDITHANASYHLRVLLDADLLVVDGEERIRGGVAKRYRHPHDREQRAAGDVTPEIEAMAQELVRRAPARRPGPSVLADAELWVPQDAWDEALDLVRRASRLVHDRARPPRSADAVKINLSVAAFGLDADR